MSKAEKEVTIFAMYGQGFSMKEIASEVGWIYDRVYRTLKRSGRRAEGTITEKFAETFSIEWDKARKVILNYGH